MKKTLFDFCEELSSLFFDKKKVLGLVKRANNAGFNIYYAFHEDDQNTWKSGWSSDNYKNDTDDVKLFEAKELIVKKKPSLSFQKAQTYTAECAIFVFCPLSTLLNDEALKEEKINSVRNKAAECAKKDYEISLQKRDEVIAWEKISEENKTEIKKLQNEINENLGQPNSRKIKHEKEIRISELGGFQPILSDWRKEALTYSLEEYISLEQNKAVARLLGTIEEN